MRESDGLERIHGWTLGTLVLWGLVLRLAHSDTALRHDEATTLVLFVQRPVAEALGAYAVNNHVLHTLLAQLTTGLFGESLWTLRAPAFVAGGLLVPATYLAIRRLYGGEAGLIAAALVAASSEAIKYSTNARGYSLVGLAFVLLLAIGHGLLTAPTRTRWALFVVVTALGGWAVASMVYALAVVLVWLSLAAAGGAVAGPRRRFLVRLALATGAAGILTLLLYGPALLGGSVQAVLTGRRFEPMDWSALSDRYVELVGQVWTAWHLGMPRPLALAFPLLAALALVRRPRLAAARVPLVLGVVLGPVLLALAQRVRLSPRLWLFLLPLYLGLVAAALGDLIRILAAARPRLRAGLGCALALAATLGLGASVRLQATVYRSAETGRAVDARGLAEYLRAELRPGDTVRAGGLLRHTLAYHFREAGLSERYLREGATATRRFEVVAWADLTEDAGPGRPAGPPHLPAIPRWGEGRLVAEFRRFDPVLLYERHRPPGR